MIDVSGKPTTLRTATARARLTLSAEALAAIRDGSAPKGDPLPVARVAAVQAVKNTSQIIPYCHPMPIDFAGVEFALGDGTVEVRCTVKAVHKTGVEMEALTGATVAALTLYDMLKMIDRQMRIDGVELVEKAGGKSDFATSLRARPRAAVLVISDSVAAGTRVDASGELIAEALDRHGFALEPTRVVPDDIDAIARAVTEMADVQKLDLVLTTGGTGLGPRDRTPEAMATVLERDAPGVAEAMRAYGQARTPFAMLSRGRAGTRGGTLVVNLPGSRKAVAESLRALFPGVLHSFAMIQGGGHG